MDGRDERKAPMKRTALVTLVLGLTLIVAPAAQAHVMSDDGAGGNAVVLYTDTLGGSGTTSAVPLRPDILGGIGKPSDTVTWLEHELGKDVAPADVAVASGGDSFAWGGALGATLLAAMLL